MLTHWINELMNLIAGNSRYVRYSRIRQLAFVGSLLLFVLLTWLLFFG
ncbi:hypothetical protein [Spirosoma koreense]